MCLLKMQIMTVSNRNSDIGWPVFWDRHSPSVSRDRGLKDEEMPSKIKKYKGGKL